MIDNGREFTITYRSGRHGDSLGLAGERGFLSTDIDTNTVRRQVITVGQTCGVLIESDEAVEGLSPSALRAVIMAERSGQTGEVIVIAQAGGEEHVILIRDFRRSQSHSVTLMGSTTVVIPFHWSRL